jgi:hypothetical protein
LVIEFIFYLLKQTDGKPWLADAKHGKSFKIFEVLARPIIARWCWQDIAKMTTIMVW